MLSLGKQAPGFREQAAVLRTLLTIRFDLKARDRQSIPDCSRRRSPSEPRCDRGLDNALPPSTGKRSRQSYESQISFVLYENLRAARYDRVVHGGIRHCKHGADKADWPLRYFRKRYALRRRL